MPEHLFGVRYERPSKRDLAKLERIAEHHGCVYTATRDAGRYKGWFAGPDLGWPQSRRLEDAVHADLVAAGLATDTTLTGEDVRAWRDRNGWSQARLADTLGVTVRTVSRWETGGAIDQPRVVLLALERLERLEGPHAS